MNKFPKFIRIDEEGIFAKPLVKFVGNWYTNWTLIARLDKWFRKDKSQPELAKFVEICVSVFLCVSVISWLLLLFFPPVSISNWVKFPLLVIPVLFLWILLDIFISLLWVHFISPSKSIQVYTGPPGTPPTPVRSLILVFFNWIEVIFFFAVFLTLLKGNFALFNLYDSFSIMVLNWSNYPLTPLEAGLFYPQVIFALLFIFGIFHRVLSIVKD